MYYCRNCKKVVKEGNKCSCGNELTRKDEIIYCPTCNKMYFKPSKSFTCKKCNSFVEVLPDVVTSQTNTSGIASVNAGINNATLSSAGNSSLGTTTPIVGLNTNTANTVTNTDATDLDYARMFLNDNSARGNNEQGERIIYNDYNDNPPKQEVKQDVMDNDLANILAQTAIASASASEFQDSTAQKFPHKAFENENARATTNSTPTASEPKKIRTVNDDFDMSLFENATTEADKKGKASGGNGSNGVNGRNGQGVATKESSPSKWALFGVAGVFVCAVVVIFYLFILPTLTPTYKQNWDAYISSQNAQYKAFGKDISVSTANFKVVTEGNSVVIATVKVETKAYNETTKKYDMEMKTYTVEFVSKKGEFVIKTITEVV